MSKSRDMKPISLEDMCPEVGEFTLQKTGKTYRVRKITVDDEAWMKQKFGETLEQCLKTLEINFLCRTVFRLLEDKSDFMPVNIEELDDEGEVVKLRLTGPQVLMRTITGVKEKFAVAQAFLQTIGISRPLMEKATAEAEEDLKKNESSAGETSSIESQVSMDIPLTKSEE